MVGESSGLTLVLCSLPVPCHLPPCYPHHLPPNIFPPFCLSPTSATLPIPLLFSHLPPRHLFPTTSTYPHSSGSILAWGMERTDSLAPTHLGSSSCSSQAGAGCQGTRYRCFIPQARMEPELETQRASSGGREMR